MGNIKITFNTITPIWSGDAWGKNRELEPSAVMGSLRFWFEVYCHFAGIEVKEKEELKEKVYKETLKKIENNKFDNFENELLKRLPLSISSKIFGCTGWKSRIEIEKIELVKDATYLYPEGRLSINSIRYEKKFYDRREKKEKIKYITPSWYFPKGFYGEITITFKTTQAIKEKVLFPLLKYIQKYGFIGAKNNIGYGRVEIIEPNLDSYEFDFSEFGGSKRITESIFETIQRFNIQDLDSKKLQILSLNYRNNDIKSLIKGLLSTKAKLRRRITNNNDRHYTFGFTSNNNNEATKIIPLISKEDNEYVGNFLSIVGIRNFGVKNEQ